MQSLISELRRRNVLRVAAFYAAAGWVLVQAATQVFPFFDIPNSVVRLVVVAIAVGFPFALAFSWFYELTPQGLKLESEIAADASITRQTGRRLDRWIIAVLGLAVVLLVTNQLVLRKSAPAASAAPAAAAPAVEASAAAADDKSIAVLPFENLSDDKSNAYFAEGIQDEILTRLAKVGALSVVSRTSTQQYASKPGNLSEIARQLGVANILEGSVQKAGDSVHINVQLIRAATDKHLWAESYDRRLDNVFGVEGEVAGAIADALNTRLSGSEQQAVASIPTRNAEAYDAYLRGKAIQARANAKNEPNLRASVALYEQAVKLDPGFAEAWGELAKMDASLYFEQLDASPARREAARQAADTALRLQPDAAEPQIAEAFYQYWVLRDYDTARGLFERLHARLPNSGEIVAALALIARRQGRWDESLAHWAEAVRRDPRNLDFQLEWGQTLTAVRRYADALQVFDRALDTDPTDPELLTSKMGIYQLQGDLDRAGALAPGVRLDASDNTVVCTLANQFLLKRDFAGAIAVYRSALAAPAVSDLSRAGYQAALGDVQRYAGDTAGARASFLEAQRELDAALQAQPENHSISGALALVKAGLGDMPEALRLARLAASLLPRSRDALDGPGYEQVLAQVQLRAGDSASAFAALPELFRTSSINDYNLVLPVTPAVLRLYPEWDAVRGDARFQKIVADAEAAVAPQPRP